MSIWASFQIYFAESAKFLLPGSVLTSIVFGQLQVFRLKALKKKEQEAKAQ